jgi:hypothetical protein
MAATAPKTSARGLELSEAAAPVLWGIPPVEVEEPVGLVAEEDLDKVAEAMVELEPAEGMIDAEAATEALELKLARTEETDAFALEAAADAEEATAEADETTEDPPVRGNWPE